MARTRTMKTETAFIDSTTEMTEVQSYDTVATSTIMEVVQNCRSHWIPLIKQEHSSRCGKE